MLMRKAKGDPHTLRLVARGLIPERFGTGEVRRHLAQAQPPAQPSGSEQSRASVPFDAEAYWAPTQNLPPEPPRANSGAL